MSIENAALFQYFEFSSFILFLFFALLQINHRKKLIVNYYLFSVFLAGSYQFFYLWLFSLGLLKYLPALLNTEIAVCFFIGPLLFQYFRIISGFTRYPRLFSIIHYLPFLIALGSLVVFNVKTPEAIEVYMHSSLLIPRYDYFSFIRILNTLGDLSMAVYFTLSVYYSSILFGAKEKTPEIRGVLIFLTLIVVNVILSICSSFFEIHGLFLLNIISFSILPLYYIFFSFRYPGYCQKVIEVTQDIRYKKSIIKKLDLWKVERRLNELMDIQKIFTNNELTLKSLSELLMITPHQLSQILNDNKGVNFRTFINTYRINESQSLLREAPEKGILEIAFAVGFNSKSVFNSAFQKSAGMSPREYRKGSKNLA